jgi:hypothetical protein
VIEGEPTGRDDTVDMGMKLEFLWSTLKKPISVPKP